MIPLRVLSASEQVAEYLRQELLCGTWVDTMPGESHLVAQLGVGRDTVKMALKHLERDGLLVPQGVGRRRKIALSDDHTAQALRVAVMLFESEDKGLDFQIQLNKLIMSYCQYNGIKCFFGCFLDGFKLINLLNF